MLDRCDDLARFPDMGRRRAELDAAGLMARSISLAGRVIIYTKSGRSLHVVRVLNEA